MEIKKRHFTHDVPAKFLWRSYIEMNPDLQHMTQQEATRHYVVHGHAEGRRFTSDDVPANFLWRSYIEMNPDLQHMAQQEATRHYVVHGHAEGRRFTSDDVPVRCDKDVPVRCDKDVPVRCDKGVRVSVHTLADDKILNTMQFKNITDPLFLQKMMPSEILDSLPFFVLIVDFPNGGGGTTRFINTIVSNYKSHTTFVILWNMDDNMIHVNINEECELEETFDAIASLSFLDKY
jgi:hypothetical protein